MAKNLAEAPITTPSARAKLPRGVHWRTLDREVHLGYRRGVRGGTWLVRWYLGKGHYRHETIGTADDVFKADGTYTFSLYQAQQEAKRIVGHRRQEAKAAAAGPIATVRSAVDAYLKTKKSENGGEERRDIRRRLERHVLSKEDLADKPLYLLEEKDLATWRDGLGDAISASTKTRIANDFKAALNAAAKDKRANLPAELPIIIKNGLAAGKPQAAVARHGQALADDLVRRIVLESEEYDRENDWEGDLYRFNAVLAATGARFSQVARMVVSDVQPENSRLMIPVSRKGRGEKASTHIAFLVGQDVIAALLPVITGRSGNEPLLERWYKKQAPRVGGVPTYVKTERRAWRSASLFLEPWNDIIERLGLEGESIVPYALRHSSIVRMLRNRLPVRLVAALHDTSSATIERHYAAAIIDALGDVTATSVLILTPPKSATVTRLQIDRKKR